MPIPNKQANSNIQPQNQPNINDFDYSNPDMQQNQGYNGAEFNDMQDIFPSEQNTQRKKIIFGILVLLAVFILIIAITGIVSEDNPEPEAQADEIEAIMEFGKDTNFFRPVPTEPEQDSSILDKTDSETEIKSGINSPIDETSFDFKTDETAELNADPKPESRLEPVETKDYFFDKDPEEPTVNNTNQTGQSVQPTSTGYPEPSSVEKYYYIQVSTLLTKDPDQKFIDKMKNFGLRVVVDSYQNSKGTDITRLLVGPYNNKNETTEDVTTVISRGIQSQPLVLKTRIH